MANTAGEQITRALRLLGVLAEAETPSAAIMQDGLTALNQMLDSWSTERLAVYTTQDQVLTWPAGVATQTLGPTGTLVGLRPVLLDEATYYKDTSTGISYDIKIITQEQYNGIAVKSVTSTFPQVMLANMGYPDVELSVYPVPTRSLEWHFVSVQELSQPVNLFTELSFPSGYLRAFTYNLACELAPEFGTEPAPQVQRIAMTSKRNLKRINNPQDMLSMPGILTNSNPRYNIYAGN